MRTFISIPLSNEAIEEIKRIQKLIEKQNLFSGKFTEPENLHLTLKFLGEIDEKKLNEVKNKLKEIKFSKFKAKLGEVGVFTPSLVKVIWVKLDGKGVIELQKKVDEVLLGIFDKEYRFMSHITLARAKRIKDKKEFFKLLSEIKIKNVEFEVKTLNLMKSELSQNGSTYSVIENFPLM